MENNQSIFDTICRLRDEQPGLPYRFQDERTAGQKDVLYVLASEGIPFWRKEELAKECCGILKDLVNKEEAILTDPVLRHFLEHYPICSYFLELRERVRITLEAESGARERLYHLGMRLARSGTDPEQVKLGIILLGFFPYDTTKQIMRTLGYHSEYTLYVLESIQFMERYFTTNGTYVGANLPKTQSPENGTAKYAIDLNPLPTATDFVIEAVPTGGYADEQCGTLTIDQTGAKTHSGTGTLADCWKG